MKVAIIGGTGNMGKLLAFLLKEHGLEVFLLGRKSEDFNKRILESDVVFFSVPIFAMDETIKALGGLNLKKKLLIDLSSLVDDNVKKLEELSSEVAFIHLMFGPDILNIRNQNIIVSNIKNQLFSKIVSILSAEGANITVSDAFNHDYMMSIIQALSQFSSISLAKTISDEKTNVRELQNFSSITYSMNADVISRIFLQNSELWAALQFNNTFFKKLLNSHIENIKELAECVDKKNYERFDRIFKKMAEFWNKKNDEVAVEKDQNVKLKILKSSIGVLGPKGSYSEQALMKLDPKSKYTFFDNINEIIKAVSSGKIQRAILPFENSIHGTVLETLDGIYEHNLKINEEIIIDIDHVIAGFSKKAKPKDIKYIYSHPQAIGQCKKYIDAKYPKAKIVLTPSTSFAFKKIKSEKLTDSLAIGSKFAADIYSLDIVATGIQETKNNKTMFVVISKKVEKEVLPFSFLVVDPSDDKSGLLHDILTVFKNNKINLIKIESRPSKKKLGAYIFYLKAEIASNDKKRISVLRDLKKFGKIALITK